MHNFSFQKFFSFFFSTLCDRLPLLRQYRFTLSESVAKQPSGCRRKGSVAPSAALGNAICGIWQCYLRHLAMQFAANGNTTLLM